MIQCCAGVFQRASVRVCAALTCARVMPYRRACTFVLRWCAHAWMSRQRARTDVLVREAACAILVDVRALACACRSFTCVLRGRCVCSCRACAGAGEGAGAGGLLRSLLPLLLLLLLKVIIQLCYLGLCCSGVVAAPVGLSLHFGVRGGKENLSMTIKAIEDRTMVSEIASFWRHYFLTMFAVKCQQNDAIA